VLFACIDQGVGGVEAQAVDVIFMRPVAGVGDEEIAHWRAARPIQVQRIAPGRLVAVGEVLPAELAQVVAIRPQVVIDHIQ
jgi:hypothetical protein